MSMKEEALKEFVDFIIQERMQKAFSEIEQKYLEAVALLPPDKEQAVREYCDAIFDSGAESEMFFYRLGLHDGIHIKSVMKKIIKYVS